MFIFHTDDVSLPSSWLPFQLVEANLPHSLTNQKHYTDLGKLVMNRIEFLPLLLTRDFTGKAVMTLQNVGYFLRLIPRLFQGFHWCTNSFRFSLSGNCYVQTSKTLECNSQ